MEFFYKGKTLTVSDELAKVCEEEDIDIAKGIERFLTKAYTTGDLDTGFIEPDLDKIIKETSDDKLSVVLERALRSECFARGR